MTEDVKRSKMAALEAIQTYMLKLKTAQEYAEHALDHCCDENYESSEFYMEMAYSAIEDTVHAAPDVPKKKKTEQAN